MASASYVFSRNSSGSTTGDGHIDFSGSGHVGSGYIASSISFSFTQIRNYSSGTRSGDANINVIFSDGTYYQIGRTNTATLPGSGTSAGTTVTGSFSRSTIGDTRARQLCTKTISQIQLERWNDDYDIRCNSASTCTVNIEYTDDYTAPSVPSGVTLASAYIRETETTTLSWNASSGGNNNPVTGYTVFRNGVEFATVDANTRSVTVQPSTTSCTYAVRANGDHGNSSASSAVTLYTYSDVTAPRTFTASESKPHAGDTVTLSFSGAAAGTNNPITKHELLKADSVDGTYAVVQTLTTSATSGSFSVTAPASGIDFYKVRTTGTRGAEQESSTLSILVNTAPSKPQIKLNGAGSWSDSDATASSDVPVFFVLIKAEDDDSGQTRQLMRQTDGGAWKTIWSGTANVEFTERLKASGVYRYKVVDSESAESEAITVTYTKQAYSYADNPVIAGGTRIKAQHVNDIRHMIEQYSTLCGIGSITWAEEIIAGTTSTRNANAHIAECREKMNAVYTRYRNNGIDANAPSFVASVTEQVVYAETINELYRALEGI